MFSCFLGKYELSILASRVNRSRSRWPPGTSCVKTCSGKRWWQAGTLPSTVRASARTPLPEYRISIKIWKYGDTQKKDGQNRENNVVNL